MYWCGTQTTIHGTVNFFPCPRQNCKEIVTLSLVHITDDLKHDSFLSRAVQNLTFKHLVNFGILLDLIIQFCDNCVAQYKSCRPFAELARLSLNIISIYLGEKHGKSHADALFGHLKAWMTYNIRNRHFVVRNAQDFFKFCREYNRPLYYRTAVSIIVSSLNSSDHQTFHAAKTVTWTRWLKEHTPFTASKICQNC